MSDKKSPKKPEDYFPFGEILQSSSIIFYHCALKEDFPLLYMSPNVVDVLGYENEDFETDNSLWLQRIHPEDRERVLESYNAITEKKRSVIEFRFKHKQGDYIWLRDEVKLLTDEQGNPDSLVGSSIDITDQKQAERKLRSLNQHLEERIHERTNKIASANRELKQQIEYRNRVEEQLKEQHQTLRLQELAINNLNDMVIITKAPRENPNDSEIIFVNKAFEEFTGYSAEEVIGRKPTFLHGPKTSREVLDRIGRQISNHESLREEFINYKKDGTPYWVELDMAPFPTTEEDVEYWVGINRDITQRKKAERKLEESEQRYRAFAELSFDAIFELNLEGEILNCNQRASDLFGYSRDELIGMNTEKLIPEKFRDNLPETFSQEDTTGDAAWERIYRKKDGSLFPTEVHTQLYEIGGETRLIAYVRDNTAHKEYEDTIRRSLKEKETLLSEIHHRVKNNLAIISGLLQMQAFNTEDEQLLEKLYESQSRIQSIAMVHEKLYESDSFSDIAIDQYIDDLLNVIMSSITDHDKRIKVEKEVEAISLNVSQAIPCGLLLNELITNSYKHAFPDRDEGLIRITLVVDNGNVELKVQDNGVGLPEDFDIESQSTLGITLIKTLVQQLEGKLEVASEGGAVFSLKFELER